MINFVSKVSSTTSSGGGGLTSDDSTKLIVPKIINRPQEDPSPIPAPPEPKPEPTPIGGVDLSDLFKQEDVIF